MLKKSHDIYQDPD
jgi:hypothetical protein